MPENTMAKKKCALTPADYVKLCPPKRANRMPDNTADCQGCRWSREAGRNAPGRITVIKGKAAPEETKPEEVEA